MASYEAIINLVVQGEAALNRIQKKIDNLYKTVGDLETKKKFQGSQAAASFVRQQAEELERVVSVSKQQIREQERSIVKQSKLNAAVDLYERRQRQLSRTSVANQKQFAAQIKDIEDGFKFFKDKKNASGVQAIATELGRIIEYDNELNRISDRRTANQRKLYSFSKEIAKYESFGLKTNRARKTLSNFEEVAGSNQLKQAQQYESALKNQLKLLKDQFIEQQRVARIAPSSPIRGGLNFPGSPIAEQRAFKGARAGFPSSPILGSVTMAGSPKAEQERLKREKEIAEATGLAGKAAQRLVGAQGRVELTSAIDQYLSGLDSIQSGAQKILKKDASLLKDFDQKLKNRETAKKSEKAIAEATGLAEQAAQRLVGIENRTELASAIDEYLTGLSDVQSGAEKLLKKNAKSLKDFDQRLKERGDFQKSQEKAIADAWKMRGGPALPTGFNEAGIIKQKGASVDIGAQRRLQSVLASGAIIEQGLINLRSKGANVSRELVDLQSSLNTAKQKDYTISENTLDVLASQVSLAGKFAQLQRTILAGQAGGGRGGAEVTASGLEQALQRLQEARGARQAFLGGASPAQAIDQIVREFNKGGPAVGSAAENIADTFASNLKKGASGAAASAKSFATAAAQAIKDVFGIASPSRFMIELVRNLVSTYITEIQKSYPRIQAATDKAFGEQTLIRNVKELRATSKGFEFAERPSRGFRPFREAQGFGRGTEGATREFNNMMLDFRKQMAELTTQPEIFSNLLKALPDSRITTDLVGAANRRALASELPSFMSTQRMMGPGELEKVIASAFADYFRTLRTPNPWIGAVGDYREFINKVIAETKKLDTQQKLLTGARIAGALPPSSREGRIAEAYRRSEERGRVVMAEGAFGAGQISLPSAGPRSLSDSISDLFNRISSAVRSSFGGFGGGGGGGGTGANAGGGGSANQVAQLLGFDAIADISRVSTRELEALSAAASELRAVLDPTIEGFDRLDNQLRETIGQIGRQIERRAPEADFLTRRFGPRGGQAVSEGLIGGAFPLLFGQGVGAAAGGGLGGAAGGFAGGGLGFGLSLVGTALGTAFDTLNQAAQDTGKALNYPIEGFEKLKEAGLLGGRQQEYYISKLIESGRAAEAAGEIQAEIIKKVGVQGVNDLSALGDSSSKLSKAWAEFNLQLQAALSGPMAGLLNWLTGVIEAGNSVGREAARQTDILAGLSSGDKERLLSEQSKLLGKANFFNEPQINKQISELYTRFAPLAKQPAMGGQLTPEQQEQALNKSIEAAEKIRSLRQQGIDVERSAQDLRLGIEDTVYGLRKRSADMEREAVEFRRSIEDQIFGKRQELEQKLVENDRKRQQNAIEAFDLQLQKASTELDPVAQSVVEAARQYLRIRAEGEADLQQNEKQLRLQLQQIDQETSRYKLQIEDRVSQMAIQREEFTRDVSRTRLQIERQIGDYAIKIEDYRLAMAKHRYDLEIDLEKKKQIAAREGLGTPSTGRNYANVGGFAGGRQMLHGIPGFAGYDASHASETNIHYHFAGKNPAETKAVAEYMKGLGYQITEFSGFGQRVGRHAPGSQHYMGNAFDIPGASMEGRGGMADIIAGQKLAHARILDFLNARGQQVASVQTGQQVVGAAPAAPTAPAMPSLPSAPQLAGINDLMSQYRDLQIQIKTALQANNQEEVRRLQLQTESARLAYEQQTLAPLRQYQEQNRELQFEIEKRQLRNRLLAEGVKPEIVEGELRVLEISRTLNGVLQGLDVSTNELVRAELGRLNLNSALVDSTFRLTEATIASLVATTEDVKKQEELRNKLQEILDLRDRLAGKAEDEASKAAKGARGAAAEEAKPGQKLQEFIAQATAELNDLEAVAVRVSQSIGDAVANSMANGITGLVEGTTTAKEVFAGFLKDVGNILIKEGTRMIGMYIAIGIAKMFAGLFSGAGGASKPALPGSMGKATTSGITTGVGNVSDMLDGLAANGAYFANGVAAFAKGGMFTNSVVSSPTLFKFADGGVQRTGLMGEAGPEAIMPLRRSANGRLGVEASGLRDAMNSSAGGGTGAPSLNMTFETTNIGGVEYVSRDQLEAAMAATRRDAARDGAKRGMSMTLDKLQQSPGTRGRVGLR